MQQPTFLFIDLFAGAGGTTTGAQQSGVCKVIAAVNHDPVAISSHTANHPHVAHFIEDIRTLNAAKLAHIARKEQQKHPAARLVLWASYILHGTAEHRKKQIGNAVVSHIPKAMLRTLAHSFTTNHTHTS